MTPENYMFYYAPVYFLPDFQSGELVLDQNRELESLILQTRNLKLEQQALSQQLTTLNQHVATVRAENERLRTEEPSRELKSKRKYRKRRTWLEKKFRCNQKGCRGRYSSKIALNLHKRKKHPKHRDH